MDDEERFARISDDIRAVRIQGARSIAKAALRAYGLFPDRKHMRILLSLRPTEPMLRNALGMIGKKPMKEIIQHFDSAQERINSLAMKVIRQDSVIFTHCHSTNVVNAMIYAKKHGKKFEVFNTETRPLFQGRKTARELAKAGIKVSLITDLEARAAIVKDRLLKEADFVVLGADAIMKNGDVINKMGSAMFAEIAFHHKVPVYVIADSWKFSSRDVMIEEREHQEIWENAPKHVQIRNIAFETIPSVYIKAIVSELGILKPREFARKAMGKTVTKSHKSLPVS